MSKTTATKATVNAFIPDDECGKKNARIAYFQIERDGRIIARVNVSSRLPVKAARIIAREIAEDPTDIPTGIAGVVDMRQAKPLPEFVLEAPGPDGWSPVPKGFKEWCAANGW